MRQARASATFRGRDQPGREDSLWPPVRRLGIVSLRRFCRSVARACVVGAESATMALVARFPKPLIIFLSRKIR